MLVLKALSLLAWRRQRLFEPRWLLRGWQCMLPAGFIALLSGWHVVEIGRQPWVIHGLLRTADTVSAVDVGSVWTSLISFALVYAVVFGAGIWYIVALIRALVEGVPLTEGKYPGGAFG